jgi:hypothetical protein
LSTAADFFADTPLSHKNCHSQAISKIIAPIFIRDRRGFPRRAQPFPKKSPYFFAHLDKNLVQFSPGLGNHSPPWCALQLKAHIILERLAICQGILSARD